MKLQVVLEKDRHGGWAAQCVEIPGAISQGETVEEALANVEDAIRLILEVRREEALRAPQGPDRLMQSVEVDA